ncbi:hypothetical protein JCM16774_0671 [Pseudoleptotrichia goodfellowii]|uniref:Uncharacterized protein n=1 Tax=Pseudoleptotrichia goodfellowii TaxID=157692 RepID=A0A510JBD5_9FUSO|nr:hypothetical protein JCM16774_0671 [Pseudoleptotrichia goodfellowii]
MVVGSPEEVPAEAEAEAGNASAELNINKGIFRISLYSRKSLLNYKYSIVFWKV